MNRDHQKVRRPGHADIEQASLRVIIGSAASFDVIDTGDVDPLEFQTLEPLQRGTCDGISLLS